VLQRARVWVTEAVPYSQTSWWTDSLGTYRQDCSGYVSMAWHLNEATTYWTGNLSSVAQPIQPRDLQPGDILLSSSHTLIFAGWSDPKHATFAMYEESHPGTAAHYTVGVSLAQYLADGFDPYRYNGIANAGAPQLLTLPALPPALPPAGVAADGAPGVPIALLDKPRSEVAQAPVADAVLSPASFDEPGLPRTPLLAAGAALLLACMFPIMALTAPLRQSVYAPYRRTH
jgi:hypothetical protein